MEDETKTPETKVDPATEPETPKGNNEPKEDPAPPQKDTPKFSKKERLEYAREKIDKQLAELVGEDEDNTPLTRGEYKRMEAEKGRKSAIELANDIEDEAERKQVIEILEKRITPSGNAQEDLALARGAVNSIKNQQLAEETDRKTNPKRYASTPGAPGKTEPAFRATTEEKIMMEHYGLTKEDVIAARNREKENRKE